MYHDQFKFRTPRSNVASLNVKEGSVKPTEQETRITDYTVVDASGAVKIALRDRHDLILSGRREHPEGGIILVSFKDSDFVNCDEIDAEHFYN